MNKKQKILLGLLGLLVAGSAYAAVQPVTIADILAKIGIIQKQIDVLKAQNDEPSFGGITAFSGCFFNGANMDAPALIIRTNGATSTSNTCDTQGRAKNLALLLRVGATTTRNVVWEYEWSHNNTNWFVENKNDFQANGANANLHGVATTTHNMTISGTTSVAISIDKPLARYFRISFGASLLDTNFWATITRHEDQN